MARKWSMTSAHAQPVIGARSKSRGSARQKYPPLTAPEPPTVAPRTTDICRIGRSVN